jgi:glycosyltransferase involved in cell wall biosynthesis
MSTVVQVVQHLQPGGIETMALDLAAFSNADHALIISLEGSREEAIQAWPRLEPIADKLIFLNKPPGFHPTTIWQLRQLLRRHHTTVVHTHHIGPLLYAGIAARLAGVKHIIHTEHDAWHLENPQRCKLQRRLLTLVRPTLVADANTVANAMKHHLGLAAVTVIHNGIDSERFQPSNKQACRKALGLPVDSPLIGCGGRMESVKGQNILIDALVDLPVDVHLALAGSGSLESALKQQAVTLGLAERVHFLGHLDTMPLFYQSLDVFCLPSFKEGFPLSSLEAQSCDIPAVVTDVGGSKETLCPESGLVVPAGDSAALAVALTYQLTHKHDYNPRAWVTQHGDVKAMVRQYEALVGLSQEASA